MSILDAPLPTAHAVPGPAPHLLIVRAPYYRDVVDGMTRGAERILADAGATHDVLDVAGAFELPQAIRLVLRGKTRFDGFVALGCVVKGETDHYEFLCREAMAGLMNVALQFGLALGSGLLTVHNIEQAIERSSDDGHNKGAEAAAAALMQITAARTLGGALMARSAKGTRPRTAARVAAVQALFQSEQNGETAETVIDQFVRHRLGTVPGPDAPSFEEGRVPDAHVPLFTRIVRTAVAEQDRLDALIVTALPAEWPMLRLDPVLRAMLRAGGAELTMEDGPPSRVVINEYLDVAHGFFAGEEPRMVNGMLDRLARELRPQEFGMVPASP